MSEDSSSKSRVGAYVSKELHRKAAIKSAITGKSISEFIREALEEWVADVSIPLTSSEDEE